MYNISAVVASNQHEYVTYNDYWATSNRIKQCFDARHDVCGTYLTQYKNEYIKDDEHFALKTVTKSTPRSFEYE